MGKKITKATFKSFVKKNQGKLFFNLERAFDGTIDGDRNYNDGFSDVRYFEDTSTMEHTLGIKGVWLVGSGDDYFYPYEDDKFIGLSYYNCCRTGTLAIMK